MKKLDRTVVREGIFIACGVFILSIIMQLVFVLLKKWDYTVLFGNLLSGLVAVLNFLLLGITVQNAVGKEEKQIRDEIRLSHLLRMFLIAAGLIVGIVLPCFNLIAAILPYAFPRIAIAFRPLFTKILDKDNDCMASADYSETSVQSPGTSEISVKD